LLFFKGFDRVSIRADAIMLKHFLDWNAVCIVKGLGQHGCLVKGTCLTRKWTDMRIKVRVDLTKRWHALLFSAYVAILGGLAIEQLIAQVERPDDWRKTVRGWEYAHAIQANSTPVFVSPVTAEPSALSDLRQWHRIALPIAISSFLGTFGCWLLIGVPNRAIVKRLT